MKKFFLFVLIFLGFQPFFSTRINAQANLGVHLKEPVALRPEQLISLSAVPPLTVPDLYKSADAPLLPSEVDNSTQPYFRPITSQTGFECGQSAGISFNFTYEVDR